MPITIERIPRMSLTDLLKRYELDIHIIEIEPDKFRADIPGAEISKPPILEGFGGWGKSPLEALQHLCNYMSNETIVINAYHETRLEIKVPHIFIDNAVIGQLRGK